ncbi:putative recombination nuclease [uncultured virus]|uniref:Putative recombination nuclease n=1 Tax=uncultured virus TaxID=340016 RepID=A0A218MKR0_9VIRU|nr:putative recombination nuclease [uncultured virus]
MKIKDLNITNFGVFGEDVTIDFDRYDPNDKILIIGENNDAAGADSNGAGKSTFLNAISWAIFGRTPSSVDSDDVIRRGTTRVRVCLRLFDEENREIQIVRERQLKGKHKLQWFIEGESQTQRTMKQTQHTLLNYFGILENNTEYFSDFLNTTYFSVDAVKAFAGKKSTSKDRMDLISRFLNLEVLEKATSKSKIYANRLKSDLKVVQGKIEFLRNKLDEGFNKEQVESDIQEYEVSKKQLRADIKQLKVQHEAASNYEDIKTQIADVDGHIEHYNKELDTIVEIYTKQIEDLQNKLSNSSAIKEKIEKLQEQSMAKADALKDKDLDKFIEWLEKGKIKKNNLSLQLQSLDSQLQEPQYCPDCNTELMVEDGKIKAYDSKGIRAQQIKITDDLVNINNLLAKKQHQYNELKEQQDAILQIQNDIKYNYQLLEGVQDIPSQVKELESNIGVKKKATAVEIKELSKKKLGLELKIRTFNIDKDLSTLDLERGIETANKQLSNITDEVARLKAQLESRAQDQGQLDKMVEEESGTLDNIANYTYWVDGFPAIRRWMIEAFLPTFEQQTNGYLNKMEVGMRTRFDTLTEKKSGKGQFKEAFDLSIIDENNEKRDLETYSSGETKRIGVCVGFALRELTLTKGYSNFNFLMMDEVIDSLDETGIGEFFNLLQSITGMKLLITHNTDLKTRFANTITIRKQDGVSTVIQ